MHKPTLAGRALLRIDAALRHSLPTIPPDRAMALALRRATALRTQSPDLLRRVSSRYIPGGPHCNCNRRGISPKSYLRSHPQP